MPQTAARPAAATHSLRVLCLCTGKILPGGQPVPVCQAPFPTLRRFRAAGTAVSQSHAEPWSLPGALSGAAAKASRTRSDQSATSAMSQPAVRVSVNRPPSTQTHRVHVVQHPRCRQRRSVSLRPGSHCLSTASLLHALLHVSRHQHQPADRNADPAHQDLPLGTSNTRSAHLAADSPDLPAPQVKIAASRVPGVVADCGQFGSRNHPPPESARLSGKKRRGTRWR